MSRSTVLSLSLQLGFPAYPHERAHRRRGGQHRDPGRVVVIHHEVGQGADICRQERPVDHVTTFKTNDETF